MKLKNRMQRTGPSVPRDKLLTLAVNGDLGGTVLSERSKSQRTLLASDDPFI